MRRKETVRNDVNTQGGKKMKDQKHDLAPDENPSSDQPGWFEAIKKNMPGIGLFPHCKLGDGFAQFAVGTDTGCMLIWQIDSETDVDAAALNLEKAKEFLVKEEPHSEDVMIFILNRGRRIDKTMYEARNILCMTERQLIKFAKVFYSEKQEYLRLGKAAYSQGLYKEAMSLLSAENPTGDAEAQFIIGQMYAKGRGVEKNKKIAEEWYWKAANQGHAGAALELEKGIKREKARLRRKEKELVDEVEAFAKKLLEED